MLVQFFDTDAGTTVYISPEYVVTLRPDPATPERTTMVKLRDGKPFGCRARMLRWRPSSAGQLLPRRATGAGRRSPRYAQEPDTCGHG